MGVESVTLVIHAGQAGGDSNLARGRAIKRRRDLGFEGTPADATDSRETSAGTLSRSRGRD